MYRSKLGYTDTLRRRDPLSHTQISSSVSGTPPSRVTPSVRWIYLKCLMTHLICEGSRYVLNSLCMSNPLLVFILVQRDSKVKNEVFAVQDLKQCSPSLPLKTRKSNRKSKVFNLVFSWMCGWREGDMGILYLFYVSGEDFIITGEVTRPPGRPVGPTGDRTGPGFCEGTLTGHRTGPVFFCKKNIRSDRTDPSGHPMDSPVDFIM